MAEAVDRKRIERIIREELGQEAFNVPSKKSVKTSIVHELGFIEQQLKAGQRLNQPLHKVVDNVEASLQKIHKLLRTL